MKEWQGENGDPRQRLPLAGQGTGGYTSACGEMRSRLTGLLSRRNTASHRCLAGPDPGRSPSARSRMARGAGKRFSLHAPFSKEWKNGGGPTWAARRVNSDDEFLRWHYPHQVEGRSGCFLSAEWLPCVFTRPIMAPPTGLVKGGGKKIVKKSTDCPCNVEKRGVY